MPERNFASDNNSAICPEAFAALEAANHGHSQAYGTDGTTLEATELMQQVFETDCQVYFAFTGSAANSLAIAHLCRSYEAAICHESAHLHLGECGGPEFFGGGTKLITVPGDGGQLDGAGIQQAAEARQGDFQFPQARSVSFTQATECGTVYSLEKLGELIKLAHGLKLHVHMDGARLANAVAHLGCKPAEATWRLGVDVLSFGGTKNGLAIGEAVVFFNRDLAGDFRYRWKQSGQVASKMRFVTAPWIGLLQTGAWLRNARHANACAARLDAALRQLDGISLPYAREANSVFARMPAAMAERLIQRGWRLTRMPGGLTRFTCSWDTSTQDLDALIADLAG